MMAAAIPANRSTIDLARFDHIQQLNLYQDGFNNTNYSTDSSLDHSSSRESHDFNTFESCPCINRLLTALRYFSLLILKDNVEHHRAFVNYAMEVYQISVMIDEFIYVKNKHDQ